MAVPSDADRLRVAWSALEGGRRDEGWRTIPIRPQGSWRLLAGRHFPGNEEALLVGLKEPLTVPNSSLPQGRGFRVERLPDDAVPGEHSYIALHRLPHASLDLFALMAEDIISLMDGHIEDRDRPLVQLFVGRIRAWQEFMLSTRDDILNETAELGLMGELAVASKLLDAGVPTLVLLDAWKGPLGGLHDFRFEEGAIEVKTTASAGDFLARVGSMEQLDPFLTSPLYLAAARFRAGEAGSSLPNVISALENRISKTSGASAIFNTLLISAGYVKSRANRYSNHFEEVSTRFIQIADDFPSLYRSRLPIQVTKVHYEIDLDHISSPDSDVTDVINAIGVKA